MANPFLVLGGIAVGIITAGFGILQVPGWIASAQDASAKNDIEQVSIGEAASLSVTGFAQADVASINSNAAIGVQVTTSVKNKVAVSISTDKKSYAVIVKSESGTYFGRLNGGAIVTGADFATVSTALGALPTGLTLTAP